MDNAVALVQTYLQVNGYFTIAEYPIVGSGRHGGYRTVTDLDILAFRFPAATRLVPRLHGKRDKVDREEPDPVLGVPSDQADMLIGEVKEGAAQMNEAATDPAVLEAALARFGCCPSMNTRQLAETLIRKGRTILPSRHHLRMVAFGRVEEDERHAVYLTISMGHVIRFLQDYLRGHWDVLRHAQFKDPYNRALEAQRRRKTMIRTATLSTLIFVSILLVGCAQTNTNNANVVSNANVATNTANANASPLSNTNASPTSNANVNTQREGETGMETMDKGMEEMKHGAEQMDEAEEKMDKDMMSHGMQMAKNGQEMVKKGMDMESDMDMSQHKEMMDKGMDMMDQGMQMMSKGMDAKDKKMMHQGMNMMKNGMDMMNKRKDMMKKGMGMKHM